MDNDYLPLFITEDVFIVKETQQSGNAPAKDVQTPASTDSKAEEPIVKPIPPAPKPKQEEQKIHELAIWTPPLTNEDKTLLTKILQAIKEDFHSAHVMEGISSYSPHYQKLLCFGYQKELELKIGQSLSLYQPSDHASQQILVSVAPSELHGDATQKKRLWEALQKMFL